MLAAPWRVMRAGPAFFGSSGNGGNGRRRRAEALQVCSNGGTADGEQKVVEKKKKKGVVVGSGWAGLGAAYHLCKQGFDVTVLEDSNDFGSSDDVGIQGFWYPYKNIFSLVDGLGLEPFTGWMKSAHSFRLSVQVEFPIFQDLPQLPSPLGTSGSYSTIDFDNTDNAWRKYDPITARELFRQSGCSERLYENVFAPLLQVGLFAPPEQCSSAAALAMLYYLVLAHQSPYCAALHTGDEFLKVLNLAGVDVLSVELELDKKINIANASNACAGFDDCFGWTFFDLNALHDEHKDDHAQVIETDFLLPLVDELLVGKITSYLSKFIAGLENATVVDRKIRRFPRSLTHFLLGSYKYMMRGATSFPNLFIAGDWIISRHGSWSQEKAYVTGLEAENLVIDYLGDGEFARIVPVEEDEPHIQALRSLNRSLDQFRAQLPFSDFFVQ
ncbi:hypothetical protein CDL15_Pgr019722 [Punica granatum]|uniref:Amine oxidase domain-containing protein n=1 Tax=Punica granatum TaxID=22663 RepID=A0A218X7T9_PUNGR|nr:hypothetical protein CDL15_Pgr019722 [Punica granatum]